MNFSDENENERYEARLTKEKSTERERKSINHWSCADDSNPPEHKAGHEVRTFHEHGGRSTSGMSTDPWEKWARKDGGARALTLTLICFKCMPGGAPCHWAYSRGEWFEVSPCQPVPGCLEAGTKITVTGKGNGICDRYR